MDELRCLLEDILDVLESDTYEYGRIMTVGGVTGAYVLRSPWNTECEWAVFSASATGAGSFLVNVNGGAVLPVTNGTASYGMTSQGEDNNAIDGVFETIPANGVIPFDVVWQPLPSPPNLYVQITAAANSGVFVLIAFRRKLARYIPVTPRAKSAHRPQQSRRGARTFDAGFRAQYPDEGRAYEHQGPGPNDRYGERRRSRGRRN